MIVAVLHQFIKNNHDKIVGMGGFFDLCASRALSAPFSRPPSAALLLFTQAI
jgi:hypothetical protein